LSANVRAITIGTHLMMEEHIPYIPENWEKMELPCQQYNWNGWGRNEIFDDPQFNDMWWLEINWTYEGMFSGDEPAEIYQERTLGQMYPGPGISGWVILHRYSMSLILTTILMILPWEAGQAGS
jgi:hypothetical protein